MISEKLNVVRSLFPSIKKKPDEYVFSALCIKYCIYKNPSLILSESELTSAIIDGTNDGGADFLILDPNNNEASDLIIAQAKYWGRISSEDAKNAIDKLIDFYLTMRANDYSRIRPEVISRFQTLNAEIGEESKIHFQLYTSSSQNSINTKSLKKKLEERLGKDGRYDLQVFFQNDIEEEIKEAESIRPYVEKGTLLLDKRNNELKYDDNASIVNISAKSLKNLYATYLNNLLSMNLRFFTKKNDIDSAIKNTMQNHPEFFWYKNNGITIICEDYDVDGLELKVKNFSIINGGQTTYLVFKNGPCGNEDFFITCKVIKAIGYTQEEREEFILDIAKATNSQKAIKDTDLKANSSEQIHFATAMKEKGIYYRTKRGDKVPSNYSEDYRHSDYPSTGKLYLAGIYQLPAKSRNKPSEMKEGKYYNPIFSKSNNSNSAGLIKDLLYIDYYFRKHFITAFDKKYDGLNLIPFANNSRTICIAFIGLAARIVQGNLDDRKLLNTISNITVSESAYEEKVYPLLKDFSEMEYIINPSMFENSREFVDKRLDKLFTKIIKEGFKIYTAKSGEFSNESNYLKKDSSYYQILAGSWLDLKEEIDECCEVLR